MEDNPTRCPVCQAVYITYVHGHGQCSKCGTNIEPCCEGVPPVWEDKTENP
jgi:hypothetical protein